MKKKYVPYVIGLPNMGVGLLWAANMSLIPMLVGTVTQSNRELGLLTSMGAFTGIFVQYLAGLISDRSHFKMGRRKPFIIIGTLLTTLFTLLMPLASTYKMMFVIALLFYISLNFYQGPYYSLIPEAVEDNQLGLANGFSKVVSVLGSAVIFVAGPILWSKSHSTPFILSAVIGLVTVMGAMFLIKEDNSKVSTPAKLSFDFINFPSAMKLYFSVFFVYLSFGCITPYFVKYCVKVLSFSEVTANNGLLLLTLSGAVFAYPIGVLSDKIERRLVLLLGALLFAASLAVAVFIKTSLFMFIALGVIGIGFIAIQITIYSILAEIVPPERLGEFMGIMNFFISISQFISNNLMGLLLDKLGFKYYFPIASVLMFGAVAMIMFSRFEKYKALKSNSTSINLNM